METWRPKGTEFQLCKMSELLRHNMQHNVYACTVRVYSAASVVSSSWRSCGLWPARLPRPWDITSKYRSGLPCPPPGDLPNPRIKTRCPLSPALQAGSLLLRHPGSLYSMMPRASGTVFYPWSFLRKHIAC